MRHIYIRRKRGNGVVADVEANEKNYQSIIRGMKRCNYPSGKYWIDDSEFGPCRVTPKQCENGFLYLLCVVVLVAFLLWLLGGA